MHLAIFKQIFKSIFFKDVVSLCSQCVNPPDKSEIFLDNRVSTVGADVTALCVVKASTSMVLNIHMYDIWVIFFHKGIFQIASPSQLRKMIKKYN